MSIVKRTFMRSLLIGALSILPITGLAVGAGTQSMEDETTSSSMTTTQPQDSGTMMPGQSTPSSMGQTGADVNVAVPDADASVGVGVGAPADIDSSGSDSNWIQQEENMSRKGVNADRNTKESDLQIQPARYRVYYGHPYYYHRPYYYRHGYGPRYYRPYNYYYDGNYPYYTYYQYYDYNSGW